MNPNAGKELAAFLIVMAIMGLLLLVIRSAVIG